MGYLVFLYRRYKHGWWGRYAIFLSKRTCRVIGLRTDKRTSGGAVDFSVDYQYQYIYIHLFVYLFICLFIYVFIYLCLHLYVYFVTTICISIIIIVMICPETPPPETSECPKSDLRRVSEFLVEASRVRVSTTQKSSLMRSVALHIRKPLELRETQGNPTSPMRDDWGLLGLIRVIGLPWLPFPRL